MTDCYVISVASQLVFGNKEIGDCELRCTDEGFMIIIS